MTDGPFDVDDGLVGFLKKWLPGPVSSLGPGALRGSRRYLEAWNVVSSKLVWLLIVVL